MLEDDERTLLGAGGKKLNVYGFLLDFNPNHFLNLVETADKSDLFLNRMCCCSNNKSISSHGRLALATSLVSKAG